MWLAEEEKGKIKTRVHLDNLAGCVDILVVSVDILMVSVDILVVSVDILVVLSLIHI